MSLKLKGLCALLPDSGKPSLCCAAGGGGGGLQLWWFFDEILVDVPPRFLINNAGYAVSGSRTRIANIIFQVQGSHASKLVSNAFKIKVVFIRPLQNY